MTVEEIRKHIQCEPNVKLLSAYDGRVVAPIFNKKHKDYELIKDMSIVNMFAAIESKGDYACLQYCIYLHKDDVDKIAEHRRNERIAARDRKVARARKTLECGISDWDEVNDS